MRHSPIPCSALILIISIALALPAAGQNPGGSERSGLRVGLGVEYFTRALDLKGEDENPVPMMTSVLAGLILEYKIQPGFSIAGQVGYSSTALDALFFRQLPFSLEVESESGSMGGILLGAEVEKAVLGGSGLGVDIRGQFFASLGFSREWKLPGLAVEGSAEGKPVWMRAAGGPVLTYRGWRGVMPFFYPRVDYLWGSLEFKETVQELKATEKKDIKGQSLFGLALGFDFELSSSFRARAEATLYPREGETDYSFLVRTLWAF
jgi:hypothetical protein